MSAAAYNRRQLELGYLTDAHLVEIVRRYQADHGLVADGRAGPATIASLEAPREAAAAGAPPGSVLGWLARAAAVLRGPLLTEPAEPAAVARARSMVDHRPDGAELIFYELGRGGTDAEASHPGQWSSERLRWEVDCSGFVCWCVGTPRRRRDVTGAIASWDGWVSTDTMVADAGATGQLFEVLDGPEPGCVIVYPGIRDDAGKRLRIGHTGLVVEIKSGWQPGKPDLLRVVHASSSANRIVETGAHAFRGKGALFLRYRAA